MRVCKALTLLAAGIVLIISAPVNARPGHGGVALAQLCDPSLIDIGCTASPGGSFQVANFFTGYTGTTYPIRSDFTSSGVDYKVGMPSVTNAGWSQTIDGVTLTGACGMDQMQDPKTATVSGSSDHPGCGIMPEHCAYAESVISAQLTVPTITCQSTSNDIVLEGFNLDAVGGHDATYWFFAGTHTGKKVIAFNNMAGTRSTYYQNALGSFSSGSSGDAVLFANNMFGHWVDSFSTLGSGTCTIASATMTCSGDSGFAVGQFIGGTGVTSNSEIISVNGSGGYTLNHVSTVSSPETITSVFLMGGGMGLNTSGDIYFEYNAATQLNGRTGTANQRGTGGTTTTVGNLVQRYNYVEACIYSATGIHYEVLEYVLTDGQHNMTYTNMDQTGNVTYQPASCQTSTTTATYFISTGAVANPLTTFAINYVNLTTNNNVEVAKGGSQNSASLATWGSSIITNFTANDNYTDRGVGTYYMLCNGSPTIGGVFQTAFFTGSDDGAHNLTVSVYSGGIAIAIGQHVYETHGYITAQQSGTAGGVGVYTVSDTNVVTSHVMRSAPDTITNAPTTNSDYELTDASHTPLTLAQFISYTFAGASGPCLYPGYTAIDYGRIFAVNDNVKDADRRKAS